MSPFGLLGLDLQSRRSRACGLCGTVRELSRTHVPSQEAGNGSLVRRARQQVKNGVLGPGRFSAGGMWVRGLCADCNHLSGTKVDRAYADFALALRGWLRPNSRRLLPQPSDVPAVPVAPGLVARSVLFGMHAISPGLRTRFPQLATDLLAGEERVKLPVGLSLRVAMYLGREARLAGPIHSYRVLSRYEAYPSQGEIYFPPLAWVLTIDDPRSVFELQRWAAADDWPLYANDVTRVDLRMLTRTFPLVQHPLSRAPDEWISLTNDDIAPILVGDVQPW